jgi:hypothetical protein
MKTFGLTHGPRSAGTCTEHEKSEYTLPDSWNTYKNQMSQSSIVRAILTVTPNGLSRRDEALLEEYLKGNKMITTGIVRHITDDDTLNQLANTSARPMTPEHKQNTDHQLLTAFTQTQPSLLSSSSAETPTLALYNTDWVSAQNMTPILLSFITRKRLHPADLYGRKLND